LQRIFPALEKIRVKTCAYLSNIVSRHLMKSCVRRARICWFSLKPKLAAASHTGNGSNNSNMAHRGNAQASMWAICAVHVSSRNTLNRLPTCSTLFLYGVELNLECARNCQEGSWAVGISFGGFHSHGGTPSYHPFLHKFSITIQLLG
jgi:hypothetical protein